MTKPLIWTLSLVLLFVIAPAECKQAPRNVTSADLKAVSQAIEDEIYDFGYQGWDFGYVGKTVGPDEQQIRIYVQPKLEEGASLGEVGKGLGYVIYKYMPFGEVLRLFWFDTHGLVVLGGNPEFGFPPTHPNYLTVFMDDDELCHDKQTWLRSSFVIQLHPSAQRLQKAAERQKERIGYSVRLDPSHRLVPAGRDPRCPVI